MNKAHVIERVAIGSYHRMLRHTVVRLFHKGVVVVVVEIFYLQHIILYIKMS